MAATGVARQGQYAATLSPCPRGKRQQSLPSVLNQQHAEVGFAGAGIHEMALRGVPRAVLHCRRYANRCRKRLSARQSGTIDSVPMFYQLRGYIERRPSFCDEPTRTATPSNLYRTTGTVFGDSDARPDGISRRRPGVANRHTCVQDNMTDRDRGGLPR
jgi:hypothetical protein